MGYWETSSQQEEREERWDWEQESKKTELEFRDQIKTMLADMKEQRDAIQPFLYEQMGYKYEGGELRRMTEEERLAIMTPTERTQYENYNLMLERQGKALRGELPISMATQEAETQDVRVTEEMMARRGMDPRSTAGIQTQKALGTKWGLIKEQEQRGILQGTVPMIGGTGSMMAGRQGQQYGQLQSKPYGGMGLLGGYQRAMQPYTQDRAWGQQWQMQQSQNQAGLMSSIAGLGGMGLIALMSDPKKKKNINKSTLKTEKQAIDMVKDSDTYTYRYKDESAQTPKRMGLMSTTAPAEVATPDRKGIDVGRQMGLLTLATKGLIKKVNKMERRKT